MWSICPGLSTQKIYLHTLWSVQEDSLSGRVSDLCSAQVLAGEDAIFSLVQRMGTNASGCCRFPVVCGPRALLHLWDSVLLPLTVAWVHQERCAHQPPPPPPPQLECYCLNIEIIQDNRTLIENTQTPTSTPSSPQPTVLVSLDVWAFIKALQHTFGRLYCCLDRISQMLTVYIYVEVSLILQCMTSMSKIEQKKEEGRVQMGLYPLSQMSYHCMCVWWWWLVFFKAIETQLKFIICLRNVKRKFILDYRKNSIKGKEIESNLCCP